MSRLVLPLALAVFLPVSGDSTGLRLEVLAGDRALWRGAIQALEPFDVAFIHSSERCLWTHHYRAAAAHDIEQLASTFSCFGAGMPSVAADGSVVTRTSAGYRVAAPAHIGDLSMMASQAAGIALSYRGARISIGEWFSDFERLTIRIR